MKLTAKFRLLKKGKVKNDLCTITLAITYDRKTVLKDTGKRVTPDQFIEGEAKTGRIIRSHPHQDELNDIFKALIDKVYEIERSLLISQKPITAKTVRDKLKHERKNAIEIFRNVLAEDRRIKIETKKAISSMITRLSEFNPDIDINQIDYTFAKSFESFLLKRPSRNNGELSVNTVNKYIRDLSGMLTRCLKFDIVQRNRLEGYDHLKEEKPAQKKTAALSLEDVERLESIDMSKYFEGQKLHSICYTIDAFLFSVYTGLRLSDIMEVKARDLKGDILIIQTLKGENPALVQLPIAQFYEGKPMRLFKKYARNRLPHTKLFADRSRETHQGNMIILRPLLFPGRKVSFHSGRHTFATLMAKYLDPFTLQAYLGHADVKTTTQVYIKSDWERLHKETKDKLKKAE